MWIRLERPDDPDREPLMWRAETVELEAGIGKLTVREPGPTPFDKPHEWSILLTQADKLTIVEE